jgi:hypothetical protein
VFTARYALILCIKQIGFVFKGLRGEHRQRVLKDVILRNVSGPRKYGVTEGRRETAWDARVLKEYNAGGDGVAQVQVTGYVNTVMDLGRSIKHREFLDQLKIFSCFAKDSAAPRW